MDIPMNETREKLIELVKQGGEEIIRKAKYIVGDGENLCRLDVTFSIYSLNEIPTIEVNKEYPIMPVIFNNQENHD